MKPCPKCGSYDFSVEVLFYKKVYSDGNIMEDAENGEYSTGRVICKNCDSYSFLSIIFPDMDDIIFDYGEAEEMS
jgi:hypothetical protein